ncbi:hypothetical protein CDD81_4118 [Ophiocordyceps australis]|uniref:Uncharacterized protein n=1 Tax=Ophiocordyceps australis TaxID=1399860 RepID=A0A2C5Y7J7_9HYPO|nr:hypothetical protein CDD81_4118 [Ophiocordyceps australis]
MKRDDFRPPVWLNDGLQESHPTLRRINDTFILKASKWSNETWTWTVGKNYTKPQKHGFSPKKDRGRKKHSPFLPRPVRANGTRGAKKQTWQTWPLSWNAGTRINEMQVVGTHNSYHVPLVGKELSQLKRHRGRWWNLQYSHLPLDQQLKRQQVRSLELDVRPDPWGGRFAIPYISTLTPKWQSSDNRLFGPGSKVLHIPDIDYRSNCVLFTDCLLHIRNYLDNHPAPVPIIVLLEARDSHPLYLPVFATVPSRKTWMPDLYDALEHEIRSVFLPDRLLTPDMVRMEGLTLEQSILWRGWPTVQSARGRVMFVVDGFGESRRAYLKHRPNLEGRLMFTVSKPGKADCTFLKINNPKNVGHIRSLVKKGYLVRTRADKPVSTVLKCSTKRRTQAFESGAHIVSTDFPVWGTSKRWRGCDYAVRLPGGKTAHCNPVSAKPGCHDDDFREDP